MKEYELLEVAVIFCNTIIWKCFSLLYHKVNKVLAAQLCQTLCDLMDSSPPGSSVQGILQARTLEWVVIPFSRGSSWPRDRTWVSSIAGRFFFFLLSHQGSPLWSWDTVFPRQNPTVSLFAQQSNFVVPSLSHVWLFATLSIAAHQASLSFTISQSLLKHMSIESVMPSNKNILFYFIQNTVSRIWFDTGIQSGQASRNIQELTSQ